MHVELQHGTALSWLSLKTCSGLTLPMTLPSLYGLYNTVPLQTMQCCIRGACIAAKMQLVGVQLWPVWANRLEGSACELALVTCNGQPETYN